MNPEAEEIIEVNGTDLPTVEVTEEPPLDAVIVVRKKDPETGNISVDVLLNGEVEADQVQTLLEIAVPAWREKIGLPKR